MANHLRIASAADAEEVCPHLIEAAESIVARVKSGEVIGLYVNLECRDHREPLIAGEVDVDGIAGFTARVLASLADNAQ